MTRILTVLFVALFAVACQGEATHTEPSACMLEAEACVAACPANAAPSYTQHDSCQASCNGTLAACEQGALPALTCERVDSAPHACASSGCWATMACNRDPSKEMGLTCSAAEGGLYACAW